MLRQGNDNSAGTVLSFKVKNLGRIAEADFTAAPLTILVGQNNTGKSYLASLIWLLARPEIAPFTDTKNTGVKWLDVLISRFEKEGQEAVAKYSVGPEQASQCVEYLQSLYHEKFAELLGRLFSYEGFEESSIQLRLSNEFETFEISISRTSPGGVDAKPSERQRYVNVKFSSDGNTVRQFRFPSSKNFPRNLYIHRVLFECAALALFGRDWQSYRNPVYIPAARTGLMLTIRSLIAERLDFDSERETVLPLPIADFVSTFVRAGAFASKPKAPVASWLEDTVLNGTLDISEDEVPSFAYVPAHSSRRVPLHATSSMITEMAPFIHLIKYNAGGHFIFEEPEAHLHLSAQRQMARAIARLLNAGAKFTITTHSDTFVQQINNLMRLHGHPDRQGLLTQYGYDESDVIDPSKARAYEFTQTTNGTEITELNRTDEGFVVPSLNETLISLTRETIDFNEEE
jgi:hypothetical protein